GDLEKVKEYLQLKKHDVNVQDREYRTPLHPACANGYSNIAVQCEKENCATILLDHGADPNLVDLDGSTALHYADVCTPLLLAITENNAEMVEFLLKRGVDVNASDKNQKTALMIALGDGLTSLVSLLLQEADLSCQDIYGFTAEEYASLNGFTIYHQLFANYGKEKKVKQMSNSEDTTLGTTFDTEEPKEERDRAFSKT
ncbi:hypothetical protein HPG69_000565, partial [Diceros bicornis minor]